MHEEVRGQLARIVLCCFVVVFPTTVWVSRIKLGSSGLAASTFPLQSSPHSQINFTKFLEIDNLIKRKLFCVEIIVFHEYFLKLSTYIFYISSSPLQIILLTHLPFRWSAPEDRIASHRS